MQKLRNLIEKLEENRIEARVALVIKFDELKKAIEQELLEEKQLFITEELVSSNNN